MNKTEMGRLLAEDTGLTYAQAHAAVDDMLALIAGAVASGDTVKLAGHGTYKPVARAARAARNPATGDLIQVPARVVPVFTAGATFKARVNESLEP